MTPRVNLLPETYRRARARRIRARRVCALVVVALAAEMAVGVALHWRAQEGRRLLRLADQARTKAAELNERLSAPRREASLISEQLALAERLHERHLWSRLLATLSATMPERVTLTALSTDPPRWSPSLQPAPRPASAGPAPKAADAPPPQLLEGVSLKGLAPAHQDLAGLMSALQKSGVFASLDLRDMRRDASREEGAMTFELHCRW